MDPRARALLFDVHQAGMLVDRFTSGKSFDDYVADPLLRSGVERQLEIIGEALNQLAKINPDEVARITDYRRIIALRNILVHPSGDLEHHRAQPPPPSSGGRCFDAQTMKLPAVTDRCSPRRWDF